MLDRHLYTAVNEHLYKKLQIRRVLVRKLTACLYHDDREEAAYLSKMIDMLNVV